MIFPGVMDDSAVHVTSAAADFIGKLETGRETFIRSCVDEVAVYGEAA